ncbi:MAG TPA: amidase [Candidatus Avidesulfovibrio excrementigallinarum]|nr:amidase [Candidatus Avidesulfovibrio excrementigallinarum]
MSYPSLHDIAAQLRAGSLSVQELLQGCLTRIEALNTTLNAVVTLDPTAMTRARELDEELRNGHDRGLLHGMPLLVKDNINVAGLPTTVASPLFQNAAPATSDAPVIAGLRKAGAIILGKTNMDELAAHVSGRTSCYGATVNPWNPSRRCSPGGSSSGSAAAVAAGLCVAALGSDTGGSVRLPAGWCGLFGMRPSWGLFPTSGIYPRAVSMDTPGVLATSAAGMAPLLRAMLQDELPGVPLANSPRIGVMRQFIRQLAVDQPAIADRYDTTIANWEALGFQTVEVTFPLLVSEAVATAVDIIRSFEFYRDIRADVDASPLKDRMHAVPAADYAAGRAVPAEQIAAAQKTKQDAAEATQAFFAQQGLDALLLPTALMTAPRLDDPAELYKRARLLVNLFSITGNPTLVYPGGRVDGMPCGMQLVGRVRADAQLLAFAEAYDRRFHPFCTPDEAAGQPA